MICIHLSLSLQGSNGSHLPFRFLFGFHFIRIVVQHFNHKNFESMMICIHLLLSRQGSNGSHLPFKNQVSFLGFILWGLLFSISITKTLNPPVDYSHLRIVDLWLWVSQIKLWLGIWRRCQKFGISYHAIWAYNGSHLPFKNQVSFLGLILQGLMFSILITRTLNPQLITHIWELWICDYGCHRLNFDWAYEEGARILV